MSPSRNRSSLVYLLLFVAIIVLVVYQFQQSPTTQDVIPINKVANDIQSGLVERIVEDNNRLRVIYSDGKERYSHKESETTLVEQLKAFGVTTEQLSPSNIKIEVKPPSPWVGVATILGYVLPFLFLAGVFWFVFRQAQGSNNAAMSFGKSRARMFTGDQPKVTFQDVAGVDEAKEELQEVVEFLREPEKFISLGARIPKGVLLVGPPGTGKTLLAKAVSGEAGVPFFSISGSEFVEMFVGVGASRVRDLFDQAKRHSPCIVFVDEIDAVGRQRGAGLGGSHDEREQTLNQMLVEMDGFDTDTNVIIVAATNRPDILDPALLRPGRFDRRVVLDRPDMRGREAILKVHTRGKPLAPDVDLSVIARSTPGFVGADLENLVNEAAILAARRNKKMIGQAELEEAIERVIAGPERKSRLISAEEKRIIAYHEAGHAVVMNALPEADPVHKVSIIARGMAGGYTIALPEEDRTLIPRKKMIADMVGLLGGRAAEELVFDDITSGAANDLERVTRMARAMVTRLGMSEELGPLVYGQKEELIFLGREIAEQRDYSEAVAQKIDEEVRKLVNQAYERAKAILIQYRDKLDAVAQRLLEVETISREEFEAIFPPPFSKNGGTPVPVEQNRTPAGQPA
ncbi:MAG: ATP-dependent zinc metalloprotease FtsH [Anaerolineales bacterium]|nr:ATP-dependent zinc metalloprotease FtsH [Anaerolineales bacterium]MDW8160680.1 ATP-dependent zinc metalloprotease FtsH [Anaerolineales bacterium]